MEVRVCICGCGRQLTGAKQQRRHPDCRRDERLARSKRWQAKKKLTDPDFQKREAARAASTYRADPELARQLLRDGARERHARDRLAALAAYGGSCTCCGEARPQFLTLQHPNKDGHKHRKELVGPRHRTSAGAFLRRLRKAGFPNDYKIEVCCWNCHMAIDLYGACPHQTEQPAG